MVRGLAFGPAHKPRLRTWWEARSRPVPAGGLLRCGEAGRDRWSSRRCQGKREQASRRDTVVFYVARSSSGEESLRCPGKRAGRRSKRGS